MPDLPRPSSDLPPEASHRPSTRSEATADKPLSQPPQLTPTGASLPPGGTLSGRRVLVTGASGFVGRWLVDLLVQQGGQVTCLCRAGIPRPQLTEQRAVGATLTLVQANLHDAASVQAAVTQADPELVFHLAARTAYSGDLRDLPLYWQDNVVPTSHLLAACQALGERLHRFVFVGSSEEYGPQATSPLHEAMAVRPCTPYGLSKATATLLCQASWQVDRVPTTVVRPFMLYGVGHSPRFFLSQALAAAQSGQPLPMSRGEQTRDFLHIQDAVRGMLAAALCSELRGEIVNLCSGEERSLEEICTLIEYLAGKTGLFVRGALPYRCGETFRLVGCNAKLRATTGWSAQHTLEEGLSQLLGQVEYP
jgi:nucleoside-diphosphate-sugar epimerase